MMPCTSRAALLMAALLLSGCSLFKHDKPAEPTPWPQGTATLLVLPPVNNTHDVKAPAAVYAQVTRPLAEAGYYVLPVSLVEQTFRDNGLSVANDIHAVSPGKLREIFGADAVLYLQVQEYGSSYRVVSADAVVTVEAVLYDLRTGRDIWRGRATASSGEGSDQHNILVNVVSAVVQQVAHVLADTSYKMAGVASDRLLSQGSASNIPPGPRRLPAPRN